MDKEIQTAWNTLISAGILDYWDAVDLAIKYYEKHPHCGAAVENLFGESVEENAAFQLAMDARHPDAV